MARFSFPILDKKDLIKSLHDLGAPKISEESLLKPTPEVLWPIFLALTHYMEVESSREELHQPIFNAIDLLEYPELHTDSIGILNSYRLLKKIQDAAGTDDFSLLDIFRPDMQRTIRFLSAGVNYCMYRKEKIDLIARFQEDRDKELMVRDQLREELAQLQNEIANIETERLARQPQLQALEAETKEFEHMISSLNKQQSSLQSDIRNLKQENLSCTDKIANANFRLMQKQQEGAQLRSQIVENPEKLQRTLEEKRLALVEEESQSEKALQNFQKWKTRVDVLTKVEKKVLKHERMQELLEEQMNDHRTAEKEVKALKAKSKALEKEEWALESSRVDLNLEGQRLQELIEKLEQQKTLKYEKVSKELEASQSRHAEFLKQHETLLQVVADKKKQIEANQRESMEIKANAQEVIGEIRATRDELQEQVVEYNRTILARLG